MLSTPATNPFRNESEGPNGEDRPEWTSGALASKCAIPLGGDCAGIAVAGRDYGASQGK